MLFRSEFRIICSRPALILTRWANLGTGIDRDDPLWKIHVFTCKDEKMPSILSKELRLHRPRKSYENTASLSLKELSSRNLSYLQGDQYKNWLSPSTFDGEVFVWHSLYGAPLIKLIKLRAGIATEEWIYSGASCFFVCFSV